MFVFFLFSVSTYLVRILIEGFLWFRPAEFYIVDADKFHGYCMDYLCIQHEYDV